MLFQPLPTCSLVPAVLLATLAPAQKDLEVPRIVEATVGAVVGLVVVALLLPINPMRILDRDAAPIYQCLAGQLREVSAALATRDQQRAVRALDTLRGMGPDLDRMHQALSGAEEVVSLAPARWRRRQDVERFARATSYLERAIEHSRGVACRSAMALQYNEPIPADLSVGVGERGGTECDASRRGIRSGRWRARMSERRAPRDRCGQCLARPSRHVATA